MPFTPYSYSSSSSSISSYQYYFPSLISSNLISDSSVSAPMDPPPARSPRKELQGPRPAPLKIHKDSHKIRKPPVAPPPGGPHKNHPFPPPPPPLPPRQPVIIYAVSPKIIHTNPSEFMNLVQRLTGLSSSSAAAATSSSSEPATAADGAVSPAARYSAIEKANSDYVKGTFGNNVDHIDDHAITSSGFVGLLGFDHHQNSNNNIVDINTNNNNNINYINNNKGFWSGILSPGPGSLQPIPAGFFSPSPSDTFFNDLMISPAVFHGGFTASPVARASSSSSFFVSPRTHHLIASPTTPSLDHLFFNNIFSDHNL